MANPFRRRPTAAVLADAVKTIGKRRFEIRQRVSCPQSDRHLKYKVETWLFLPQSLQINRWSYTAVDYQQSLKNYIRIGVPVRPLESMLERTDPRYIAWAATPHTHGLPLDRSGIIELEDRILQGEPERAQRFEEAVQREAERRRELEMDQLGFAERLAGIDPEETFSTSENEDLLERCEKNLDALLENDTPKARTRYEASLKLFCLLFRAAMLDRKKWVLSIEDAADRTREAYELTRVVSSCLKRFRRLLRSKAARAVQQEKVPVFLFCDEYLSIITTQVLAELVRQLAPVQSISTWVLACYGAQRGYRRKHYPDSMPKETGDNELAIFRWSLLKKYVDMPLFLTIRRGSSNAIIVHTLYSLAAAMAMAAATLITFFWQGTETVGTRIVVIAILAYIFRERIKDVVRSQLFKMFGRWIPDRVLVIMDGYKRRLGRCSEIFRFENWDKIPKDVRTLRNKTHFVDILNAFHNEDILYYSKTIDVKHLPDPFREGRSLLLDISRFEVSDFLRHADDVLEEPQGVADDRAIMGEKVYHVDVVRKISHKGGASLERFRVVLTSAGIRRIDEIPVPEEQTYGIH